MADGYFDLDAMMAEPIKPKLDPHMAFQPVNPVFVLFDGTRVPFSVKFQTEHENGILWTPIIEGNVWTLWARTHSIDADHWPIGCGLAFPRGINLPWLEGIIARSDCLTRKWA